MTPLELIEEFDNGCEGTHSYKDYCLYNDMIPPENCPTCVRTLLEALKRKLSEVENGCE